MSWLRIDDRFASHPKIAKLTDRQFRVWMRLLCYCAAHRNATVDDAALNEVKGLSSSAVEVYIAAGLIDVLEDEGRLEIHDWRHYQPREASTAFRQAKDSETTGERQATRVAARGRPVPSRPEDRSATETGSEAPSPGHGSGDGLDRLNPTAELERVGKP